MSAAARIAAFAGLLVAIFAAAALAGAKLDPSDAEMPGHQVDAEVQS